MKADKLKSLFRYLLVTQLLISVVVSAVSGFIPLPSANAMCIDIGRNVFEESGIIGKIEKGQSARSHEFSLEEGNYLLEVDYSCTNNNNFISIVSETIDSLSYLNERWQNTVASDNSIVIGFTLESAADDISIAAVNAEDDDFVIRDLKITVNPGASPVQPDMLSRVLSAFALLVLFFSLFDILRYRCLNDSRNIAIYMFLFMVAFIFTIPLMRDGLYNGNDLAFHIMRIYGIRDGLLGGQLPVKLQTPWYGGYGYIVGAFYGDLLLYIPALLSIVGFSVSASYKFVLFFVQLLTIFSSYFCFKGITELSSSSDEFKVRSNTSSLIAVCGAVAYTGMFFRFVTMYEATTGEFFATAFLPFIAYAFYLLIYGKRVPSVMMFMIGFTGLINSHILTTLMTAGFLVLTSLIAFKRVFNKRSLYTLMIAAGAVFISNLHFIVPFLDMSSDDIAVLSSGSNLDPIQNKGADTVGFFTDDPLNLTIRVILVFAAVFIVIRIIRASSAGGSGSIKRYYRLIALTILTLLSLLMCTLLFPWDLLATIPVIGKSIYAFQFPLRFLQISDILSVLMLIEYLRLRYSENDRKTRSTVMIIAALMLFFIIGGFIYSVRRMTPVDRVTYDTEANIHSDWISGDEYLIAGTDPHDIPSLEACLSDIPGIRIADMEQRADRITFLYSSDQETYVELPLFSYRHYKAVVSSYEGREVIDVMRGSNNRVSLNLPAATDGSVDVRFITPWCWKMSYAVSLCFMVVLTIYYIKNKRAFN